MAHFGPKMAKHGRLVNVLKWSKRVSQSVTRQTRHIDRTRRPGSDKIGPVWVKLDSAVQGFTLKL